MFRLGANWKRATSGLLGLAMSASVSAEDINIGDYLVLPTGVTEQVHFSEEEWQGEWCNDGGPDDSTAGDPTGDGSGDPTGDGSGEPAGDGSGEPAGDGSGDPLADGGGEGSGNTGICREERLEITRPLAETVQLGGEIVNVFHSGIEKEYYKQDGEGLKLFGWHEMGNLFGDDWDGAGRVYSFVSAPADIADVANMSETELLALLDPSNLQTNVLLPATVTLGESYSVSTVTFEDLDEIQDVIITGAQDLESMGYWFDQETFTFGASRIDLTDPDSVAADADLAELLANEPDGLTEFLSGWSDTGFLTNLVKVVIEGNGVGVWDGELESESWREVLLVAEGVGIVLSWGIEQEDTETDSFSEWLVSYSQNGTTTSHAFLGKQTVTVESADGEPMEHIAAAFCTMQDPVNDPGEIDQCVYGGIINANTASANVDLYYLNEEGFDQQSGKFVGMAPTYVPEVVFHSSISALPLPVLTLEKGVLASGTITDENGEPVEGVWVKFVPYLGSDESGNTEYDWENSQGTHTDFDGSYSLHIAAGQYSVQANFEEDNFSANGWINADGIIVNEWPPANVIDIQADISDINGQFQQPLGSDATIAGTVIDSNGEPVPAEIYIRNTDWTLGFWAQSDAQGQFSVGVLQGERYVIEAWPQYDSGVEFSGGHWFINPESPLLANNQEPLTVFPASAVDPATCYAEDVTFCETFGTGWVPGVVLNIWDENAFAYVDMDAESLTIGMLIDLGTPVEGRLVDDQGNGIANAWINGGYSGTSSDESGYFTLRLPSTGGPETFQVDVWPGWNDQTQQQDTSFVGGVVVATENGYTVNSNWEAAAQFAGDASDWPTDPLDAESNTGLLITVQAAMTIEGTVDFGGFNAEGWVNAWSPDSNFGGGAPVDPNGSFSLPIPTPAAGEVVTYEVSMWSPNGLPTEPVTVVVDENGVVSVNGDTSVTTVSFALSQGTQISGRVVDENGVGVPWTWVEFKTAVEPDEFGNIPWENVAYFGASTDENGFYNTYVDPEMGPYVGVVWGWSGDFATNFYNGTAEGASNEEDALPIDVTTGDAEDINFSLSAGLTVSGTVEITPALPAGYGAWINMYSESAGSWGGTWIEGDGSTTSFNFEVSGLQEASDYRLDIWAEGYIGGFYGGDLSGTASSPVNWEEATLIDTTGGDVSNVNMTISAGSTITLTVTADPAMEPGTWVDANVWSDSMGMGAWGNAEVSGGTATVTINGVDPAEGANYRLWVSNWQGNYQNGFYEGDLSTAPGSLVTWDQATLFDATDDLSLAVELSTGGSISGTVTGLPAGVSAWIDTWSENTGGWGGIEVVGDGGEVTFTITGLTLADDYRVGMWAEGLKGGYWAGLESTTLTNWSDAGRVDISDSNNKDFAGVVVTLEQGKSITGSVTGWSEGEEFQWGWVDSWSPTTYSWSGASVSADETDYALYGLDAAPDYEVHLWADGYTQQQQTADVSTDDAVVDFVLSTGGSISGSVSGLEPFQTIWLDAWGTNDTFGWGFGSATADESGELTYTINGLADGDYVVGFWIPMGSFYYNETATVLLWHEATPVTVAGGADVTAINFEITEVETYSLSGIIGGLPDEGVAAGFRTSVSVWSENGAWGYAERIGNGDYEITGLPAGNYYVDAYAPNCVQIRLAADPATTVTEAGVAENETWTSSWDWNDLGTVPVTQDTTELDVNLFPGLSISGTVVDQDSNPLTFVWVNITTADGFARGGSTNENGEFAIPEIEPNQTYTVSVWTPSGEGSETVEMLEADVADVTVVVTQAEGSVSGTITEGGSAAEGIQVYIYEDATGDFVAAAATAADGGYSIGGLSPDTDYRVEVYDAEALIAQTANDTATVTATAEGAVQDFNL